MTDYLTIADMMTGSIDLEGERQWERDFFWAIAFDLDRELMSDWEDFVKPPLMFFEEIHQIISDFDEFAGEIYDCERLEAFVAGQIWIEKIREGSVLNLEFLPYLQMSPLARWVEGKEAN